MGGISISIHPLFFVLGGYYALTGKIFIFIICTVVAVVHELGHSLVASGLGYKLNKIVLMPFGALVSGNTNGLKFLDEVKIALAGPFINIGVALFFIAMWWIYPDCYAYTDVVVSSNLSMALVNLLPIYPLDGGRIVFAMLGYKVGYEKAFTISKIIGIVFSCVLLLLFILSLINGAINLSLLFFCAFVLFGALSREKENKYVKIFSALSEERLMRGTIVLTHAVHKDMSIKKLITLLDQRAVNEVAVFEDGVKIAHLNQREIEELIKNADIYSKISKNITFLAKNSSVKNHK